MSYTDTDAVELPVSTGDSGASSTLVIYTLSDPRTGEVRYVGKTNDPHKRYVGHINQKLRCHKTNWVQELLGQSLKPVMEILEEFDGTKEDWQEIEKFWIETLRFYGCRLTNQTPGGDGCVNNPGPSTPEHKAKIGNALRGKKKSPEHIAKMRAAMLGHKRSAESIAKQAASLKSNGLSDAARKGLAIGHARIRTPEENAKSAASRVGLKRTPEQRERMRAAAKLRSSNPEWKNRQSAAMKKFFSDPEKRAAVSASLTGKVQDRDAVEKRVASWKENWEKLSPEEKLQKKSKANAVLSSPDHRAARSETSKAAWERRGQPAREEHSQMMLDRWATKSTEERAAQSKLMLEARAKKWAGESQ